MDIAEVERILLSDALSPDERLSANVVALDIAERRRSLLDGHRAAVVSVLANWLTKSREDQSFLFDARQMAGLRNVAIGLAVNWNLHELRSSFRQMLRSRSDLLPGDRASIAGLLAWLGDHSETG